MADTEYDIVLDIRNVSHWFGENRVLHDVNLQIVRGEIVGLVGPSGCGKSTLLRAILGTHPPNSGTVQMNGKQVAASSRDCGVVYQRYTLYPFLTALENVAFGPLLDQSTIPHRLFNFRQWRQTHREHRDEAASLLEKLKLGSSLNKYPNELSGGMQQRVAIAQALIMKPQVLLLDEPFGALDEATREEMQETLLRLYGDNLEAKRNGEKPPYTILMVTHELTEAILVSDRVVGLSQYWNWSEQGHKKKPGATVVYDAVAPVFNADSEHSAADFVHQRSDIRSLVMNEKGENDPADGVRFWDQVKANEGHGILHP